MLIEHVACRAHTDKDFAAVAVGKHRANVVEDAPTRDHVELVDIVFDVGDCVLAAGGGGTGRRGDRETRVVEM